MVIERRSEIVKRKRKKKGGIEKERRSERGWRREKERVRRGWTARFSSAKIKEESAARAGKKVRAN